MHEWAVEWGLPDRDTLSKTEFARAYLAAALKAGKAGTDLFGLRLQAQYLGLLSETLDHLYPGLPSDAHRFERAFGKTLYLHLSRADKVAQAVSLQKAQQSGLWHLHADGTELERLTPSQTPRYDFQSLDRQVRALERDDEAWTTWFDRHQINPLRVSYETFVDQPVETVSDICRALGKEPPQATAVRIDLKKLSDEVNLEWIGRYKEDLLEFSRI
ncbi:hypothetical protein F11_08385 [Rhodospirillum rubrum F11]|nr:hypothetical protein F11_08385 [Rhodospirillum rubrum F11]